MAPPKKTTQEVRTAALADLVRQQQSALAKQLGDLDRLRDRLAATTDRFEERARELEAHKDDPVVVYADRTAGPAPRYHDAENPCGHGRRIEYPVHVLLGDAIAKRIRRCAVCGPLPAAEAA